MRETRGEPPGAGCVSSGGVTELPPPSRPGARAFERALERLAGVIAATTGGVRADEIERLFRRDAPEAYRVLTRDRFAAREAPPGFAGVWRAVKHGFGGLAAKLAPPRRLLFVAAMVMAVLGLLKAGPASGGGEVLLFASVVTLVFLLGLELVDRVRVRDELEVARQLQRELLPQGALLVPGFATAHSYRTANEVGGDYYDAFPLPEGRVALVIGDASGHGMAAGLLMAIANAALKLIVDTDPAPENVAAAVNRVLVKTGDRRSFMSLFYALLDPTSGSLEYVCAGHPFPLLRRADGALEELGVGSLPLGLRSDVAPSRHSITVAPGDLLLLHSDGLFESTTASGEAFGYERLKELLAVGGSAGEVHRRIAEALSSFLGGEPLTDDVSIVVLERLRG